MARMCQRTVYEGDVQAPTAAIPDPYVPDAAPERAPSSRAPTPPWNLKPTTQVQHNIRQLYLRLP